MKRTILFSIGLFACMATAGAQDAAQNYVLRRTMLNEAGTGSMDNVTYYDGLGRPSLHVGLGAAPDGKNLLTLQEYDGAGRESATWLPVALADDCPTATAIQSAAKSAYSDNLPYAKTVYEASPLNRVSQQYGPGAAWHNGHPVRTERMTNGTTLPLSCLHYKVNTSSGALTENGNYAAGELYVQKSTDEDGNVAYTFTDKQGQLLLERRMDGSTPHDTYYVYDIYGNLCYVLQPMYQSEKSLEKYAFRYQYDHRNRCVRKTLPGAEYVEYVYDDADRLTYSQDGNQRAKNTWTYYLYDKFGRLTEQGECTGKDASSGQTVHLKNYYDSYGFAGGTGFPASQFANDTSTHGKGKLTGCEVTVLGSGNKLYAAYYYDDKGREMKTVQSNLLGGYDVTSTTYTFSGMPQTVTHTHNNGGTASLTEVYAYTYDHANRLTKVEHTLDGAKVTLASYTYDNFGRLKSKSLHGSATNELEYMYNLRGWLTGITGNKLSQALLYETSLGTPAYNGNISSMVWQAGDETAIRGYNFSYDGLDRLTTAAYHENLIEINDHFTEKVTGYDKNGNITGLQRYGQTSASAYGLIDNLTYTLDGNRPTRIDDGATAAAYNGGFEFKDGVKQANEYAYDANGNLTKDLNKNISSIQYNCLNLPSAVTFADGSTITYTYAADGTKLRVVHKIGSTTTTTDYCGNVVYENGTPKYLLTAEGYVTLADKKYHYFLQDHQGNNRVVVDAAGTVEEVNHYYPFGGSFASSGKVQPYKYNSKEYDDKKGLNWYDYGARHYNAAIGRFTTQDRFAEKYYAMSPYQYGANNPIGNIDVNGDSIRVYVDDKAQGHSWLSVGEGKDMVMYSYGRYNGTYKGEAGIEFANSLANGDGVLLRLTGDDIRKYLNEKSPKDISTYIIRDIADKDMSKYLDEKFYSSNKLPDNPKSDYYNDPSAHIIDEYVLINNNCTTFVSDALNKVGSDALKTTHTQLTSPFGTYITYPVYERFIVPIFLRNHLDLFSTSKNKIINKIK